MKKLKALLLLLVTIGVFTSKGKGQEIQLFGPGVHQELDVRIETRSICIPNPTTDVKYDFDKSFAKNVNDAISRERKTFRNSKIGEYVHPGYYTDPVDYAHKILTALRKAYAEAYNIKVIDVPLDISVTTASQNHSCKMISCNQFTHQSSCTGSPKSRLSAQVGEWGGCLTGYSENIAINTSKTIEGAIEWAIFGMMYDDLACCKNGHRENFLKCTYDKNWRMGFGYQKGKYSFGTNRSYDAWFMTWDYARKGGSSSCTWNENTKAQSCPAPQVVSIQNLTVKGQSNCSTLAASWTTSTSSSVTNFEVYQSVDGKSFTRVATAAPRSDNKYSTTFEANGDEAKIFVKANNKSGSFYSSELSVFNVGDCAPEDKNEEVDVADNAPPPPKPKPIAEPEVDANKLVISPNPAKHYIRLAGVPYGTLFRIYTINGQFAKIGIYTSIIHITRLRAGSYVIKVRDKVGQFVKL